MRLNGIGWITFLVPNESSVNTLKKFKTYIYLFKNENNQLHKEIKNLKSILGEHKECNVTLNKRFSNQNANKSNFMNSNGDNAAGKVCLTIQPKYLLLSDMKYNLGPFSP